MMIYPKSTMFSGENILLNTNISFLNPTFAIVGCGATGMALGQILVDSGYQIAVTDKNLSTVKEAASIFKTDRFSILPWEIIHYADIVFMTCPDRVVRHVCEDIVMYGGFNKYSVVFHCSRHLDYRVLSSARRCDARIGVLYPVQTDGSLQYSGQYPGQYPRNPFKNTTVFIDGDHESVSTGMFISCLLGFRGIQSERLNPKQ